MVNETALPVITAVPVKKSGVDLPEADFEAWATLQVDYQ
ncbi:TPA: fimbrial protein [Escherichia coli]|nr:fimbrial protein [Escherichia coli]HCS5114418.1 fimbrial protein [Escherichia coli]